MKYLLPDGNVIVAMPDFIADHYPDAELVEEPPAPAVRTTSITMRQTRLYLQQVGLTKQVESIVSELDTAAQIEWQYAPTVEIGSPIVQLLRAELELTEEQVQDMFDEASKL